MRVLALLISLVLAIMLAFAPSPSSAQAVIQGTVADVETGEPLVGAHVFLSETKVGTVTDEAGRYRLRNVPAGFHRLFVSMIGYEPVEMDTLFQSGHTYRFDLELQPGVIEVGELAVTDERDRRWERRYNRFVDGFLGTSSHAHETRILNPEVLQFSTTWWGRLEAEAAEPLVIENRALGYRLTYHLDEFSDGGTRTRWDGEPYFEELEPRDSTEAARWQENRRTAYYGSFRHFLLSLWNDSLSDEEFIVHEVEEEMAGFRPTGRKTRRAVRPDRVFREARYYEQDEENDLEVREMRFRGRLSIVYTPQESSPEYMDWEGRRIRADRRSQRSFIELNERFVTIDETGEIKEPYGLTRYGYFAFERVAAQLPKEYRPEHP